METLRVLGELVAPLKKPHELHESQELKTSSEESESNYADLGDTSGISAGARNNEGKSVKVTFTGEASQLALFKWNDSGDTRDSSSTLKSDSLVGEEDEQEELSYTDMRLGSRRESQDNNATPTVDAESHYITTHEIQLTELDHDADCDFGRGSRWDYDDDNLVYSFVDYASFESVNEDAIRAKSSQRTEAFPSSRPPKLAAVGAPVSTESELCESDKGTSSDEGPCKTQGDRLHSTGQVHMTVKACPSNSGPRDEADLYYRMARQKNSTGLYISSVTKDEVLQGFIPAPGRQHLASKLRGKDVNEYSSGASSSISELDDADKEVRNLTAKSFRSLACPYFDAINLRTSSESSVSEHGLSLNRWSTFVDWNYTGVGRERGTLETTKLVEGRNVNTVTAASKNGSSGSSRKIELRSKFRSETDEAKAVTLTETLNVSCNMTAKCNQNAKGSCATANVTIAKLARTACEAPGQPSEVDDGTEETYKKAVFASSLLKNVISKKMQFEQECKIERSKMKPVSPCAKTQDFDSERDNANTKDFQRQVSETGSVVSLEELGDMIDTVSHFSEEEARNSSCATGEVSMESPNEAVNVSKVDFSESKTSPLPNIQNSAFKTWKDNEQEVSKTCPENDCKLAETPTLPTEKERNGKTTKMSHLYVPSSHLLPIERDAAKFSGDGVHRETSATSDRNQSGKAQEFTIRLHSSKENNSNRFSIASLLTPNIEHPVKSHVVSVSEKTPQFMVRDIRDNKWKFHTPIHQVRDVRKLVKSSYRFVSLENPENKSGLSASQEDIQAVKKEPDKGALPSPMVIKCQSVNTSTGAQRGTKLNAEISQCTRSESLRRVPCTKQSDPKLVRQKVECKLTNQAALEKLKAAVKTMEQLYVFDRNEWKRKTEGPRVVTDSHVLSLITNKELAGKLDSEDEQGKVPNLEPLLERIRVKPLGHMDVSKTTKRDSYENRSELGPGGRAGAVGRSVQQTGKSSSVKGPLRLKIAPSKSKLEARASETVVKPHPVIPDSENYLTIPVKSCPPDAKLAPQPSPLQQSQQPLQRSPVVTDSWSPASPTGTMVYHHTPQPQFLCLTPPTDIPPPNTQRKLLLDPTTGQCYLVDTPVPLQPATQRLYYPESGRYLDVPLSVTPLSVSPIALNPAYAPPAYFVYPPNLLPPPSHPQPSKCSEGEGTGSSAAGLYLAPPGSSTPVAKPLISITSQQGPRIVAPPSFDGTTMSFVVEHR